MKSARARQGWLGTAADQERQAAIAKVSATVAAKAAMDATA
jgi:hypothetical protein